MIKVESNLDLVIFPPVVRLVRVKRHYQGEVFVSLITTATTFYDWPPTGHIISILVLYWRTDLSALIGTSVYRKS